jgi:L-threonylcarbamoyladenylate synthase
METRVVKLDPGSPDVDTIREAAAVVDAGGLVAFPTETVYGIACRVHVRSLARLSRAKGRDAEKHYTLHVGEKADVEKYVPTVGIKARKLVQHAWPGPVTLVFELSGEDIARQRRSLEKDVFESLYRDDSIGIRCPDNAVGLALLRETNSPVVAPSANKAGQPPAVDAEGVLAQLTGEVDLLLDAGPCKYGESSTVVKIGKKGLEVLRQGAYPQIELDEVSQVRFLFVCTGNTCRSR